MATLTKAQAAKDKLHLAQLVRLSDGRILTRGARVRELIAAGGRLDWWEDEDHAARRRAADRLDRLDRGSDWVPTGNESHPRTIEYRRLQHEARHAMKRHRIIRWASEPDRFTVLTATEARLAESL